MNIETIKDTLKDNIIKKTLIGLFIIFIIAIIFNLKEELKVPTRCDFDECFTIRKPENYVFRTFP